jgi:citrate synthase/citryl-CoA lyase
MAVGRWKTRITDTHEDAIRVRGYDLAELIGRISFAEMFYLLTKGSLPDDARVTRMVEAMLVSCADHGIITTSVAARYAIASGTPLQGALAAGILMIGDVYGGAVEQAARYFFEQTKAHPRMEPAALARQAMEEANGAHIPGFGHPLHGSGDPRTIRLLELADELQCSGPCVALARALERQIRDTIGKKVPFNVDGALGALVVDLGFDWRISRSFMLMSRTAGVLAHAGEELMDGNRWRLPPPAEYEVRTHQDYYEGPAPRPLPDRFRKGCNVD